jgi:signal transduction histidine kinase
MLVAAEDPGLDLVAGQQVFEHFLTTKSEGAGMGLAICGLIVEAHGGRLWVSPGEPHGTAFRLTMPAAQTD